MNVAAVIGVGKLGVCSGCVSGEHRCRRGESNSEGRIVVESSLRLGLQWRHCWQFELLHHQTRGEAVIEELPDWRRRLEGVTSECISCGPPEWGIEAGSALEWELDGSLPRQVCSLTVDSAREQQMVTTIPHPAIKNGVSTGIENSTLIDINE